MRQKNEKNVRETETAFAAAMVLTNVLLLSVVCGMFWLMQSLFSQDSVFGSIGRGDFLP